MLSLFRRKRREYLNSESITEPASSDVNSIISNSVNKGVAGRYFLYAIGEIALVVIGILIALQVNNWNEKRLSINAEKSYILAIYHDLQNDLRNIESNLNLLSDHYNIGLEIMESVENNLIKEFTSSDSLRVATQLGWTLSNVIPVDRNENTWDKLKVQGIDMYIIDDSLSTAITEFYSGYDEQIERFNQLPKKLRQDLREMTGYCHNAKGLEEMRKNGLKFYASSAYTRNCILSSNRIQELVGAIMVTSIVNTDIYRQMLEHGRSIINYMQGQFELPEFQDE